MIADYVFTDSDIRFFWDRVDIRGPDDCWEWMLCRDSDGYGVWGLKINGISHQYKPHRLAYSFANFHRKVPYALEIVRHTCDNPACCNPNHLLSGSRIDNARDKTARGRNKGPSKALTVKQVVHIRSLSATLTLKELSNRFNVSITTMWKVYHSEGCYGKPPYV